MDGESDLFVLAEWVGSIGELMEGGRLGGVLIATVSFLSFFFQESRGDGTRQGQIHYAARARLHPWTVTSYDTRYTLGMEVLACLVCLAPLARLGTQPPCESPKRAGLHSSITSHHITSHSGHSPPRTPLLSHGPACFNLEARQKSTLRSKLS